MADESSTKKPVARLPAGEATDKKLLRITAPPVRVNRPFETLLCYICPGDCGKVVLAYLDEELPRTTMLETLGLPPGTAHEDDHTYTVKYFWSAGASGWAIAEHARHSHWQGQVLIPFLGQQAIANRIANVVLGTEGGSEGSVGRDRDMVHQAPPAGAITNIPGVEPVPELKGRADPMALFHDKPFFKAVLEACNKESGDNHYAVEYAPTERVLAITQALLAPLGAVWPSNALDLMERKMESARQPGYRRGRRKADDEEDVEV